MYPWLWFWAPQLNLPGSGSVSQLIEPDTNWFFGSIKPDAGNGRIEKRAFEVASYGKQLGLLADVMIDLAESPGAPLSPEAADSLGRLKQIRDDISKIKIEEAGVLADEVESKFKQLHKLDAGKYATLLARLDLARQGTAAA